MIARPMSGALLSILLLGAWLGAALLVTAVVAPAAFAVLPTRTLAGALVGRVLPALFWSGLAIGFVVAALGWTLPDRLWRTTAAVVLVGACTAAQLLVAPRIQRVREEMGGVVDALDPSDPRRQAFGRLHGMSVACLGVAGVAALVTVILLIRFTAARSAR